MAKHIPRRMCIGCRQMLPKHELIKIVKIEDTLTIDQKQKLFGRGAYICRNASCIQTAKKKRALERTFRSPVPAEFYEKIGGVSDG